MTGRRKLRPRRGLGSAATSPALRPAGHEDHIRPERADTGDSLVVRTAVVHRDHVHHNGARAKRGPLGRFRGHGLHHAGDQHLQPAARAGGGDVEIGPHSTPRGSEHLSVRQEAVVGQFFEFPDRVDHSHRHVVERGLHRGGGLAAAAQTIASLRALDENCFCGSRAAVCGNNSGDIGHGCGMIARRLSRGQRAPLAPGAAI